MYSYNHTSAPINILPIELLSEIFTLCTLDADVDQQTDNSSEHTMPLISSETVRVPLVLAAVNRKWRTIVHNQSNLWTSLCITAGLVRSSGNEWKGKRIDTTHIRHCVERSKQSPLNILIDARDSEWNFTEAGVGIDCGDPIPMAPLFSSEHMKIAVTHLIPALPRWKSLTILTDTYAPMHAALSVINPYLSTYGAPRLESLTLMRCNDFVSFSPQFQPRELKDGGFLSIPSTVNSHHPNFGVKDVLPRLRHLSLRGVHADWNNLSCALLSPSCSLESLELASHSVDVRPSVEQFHNILTATSTTLRNLVVTGSGPARLAEDAGLESEVLSTLKYEPVQLHKLQKIELGYRTSLEGCAMMQIIDAPSVKQLVLEDATYPGDPEEVNAGSLLMYLGFKDLAQVSSNSFERASSSGIASYTDDKRPPRRASASSLVQGQVPRVAFPSLQDVTLKGVKASPRALHTFFGSLSSVQHLELIDMSMQAVYALVPRPRPLSTSSPYPSCIPTSFLYPCPRLRSLCIRECEQLQMQDLNFIVGSLPTSRAVEGTGACAPLREVDLHVENPTKAASIAATARSLETLRLKSRSPSPEVSDQYWQTKVNVFSDGESSDEEDGEEEEDPFSPGGAFNDPLFDQYYASI